MNTKPIFAVTHPRSCSTAFERVFMTRRDVLNCVHEPFGDAFYFGPERLGERYDKDEAGREKSGFSQTTYKDVLDQIEKAGEEGKRIFIKDIAYYLFSPEEKPTKTAPSLSPEDEPSNPTCLPQEVLKRFLFTFLIRHPRRSIPSYYRCTVPPLASVTGFDYFMPCEAGYVELRNLFDYLVKTGLVDKEKVIVIDADDLLDNPEAVIKGYCERVGLDFTPNMLNWSENDTQYATGAFEKWNGFHNDAIGSSSLKPRSQAHKTPTVEAEDNEWREKYGEEAQKVIRACVEENIPHYEYLKKFVRNV